MDKIAPKSENEMREIESRLGYTFENKACLMRALTTKSYAQENYCESQEIFQTLGDSVIKTVLCNLLIERGHKTKGSITEAKIPLEREEGLAKVARKLEIGSFIMLGVGQRKQKHDESDHVLAETLEAIAGAIYLENAPQFPEKLIEEWFKEEL